MSKTTLRQWICFALVGGLGVIINAIVYEGFSIFDFGNFAPFAFLGFESVTIAWGMGILVAMICNFILDKFWVFKK